MLFDTNIFSRVRPEIAAGRVALLFVIIGLFGCDRSRNDQSGPQHAGPSRPANEFDEAESGRQMQDILKSLHEEQARLEAENREFERVKNLPPFENALEPTGWRRLSRAWVVKKIGDDEVSIAEPLFGRMPSDPERYVPVDCPHGLYLVGSLAPWGGYQIDAWDSEERFCLSVSKDGEYVEGGGVSARLPGSDVRQRLDAKAADGTSGGR